MFRKRLAEITPDDVRSLIGSAQEDAVLEFKATLATKDGSPDAWERGEDRIGAAAKRDLLKELIAFANTRGGTLILGMKEDGEKRAAELHLLRDCRTLADRLGASFAASVEPPIPGLDAAGVEVEGSSGVVVFRVPASYRAPHRDQEERECYHRSGDRSVRMTMYQMQDLAVGRSREAERIGSELEKRSAAFKLPTRTGEYILVEGVGNVSLHLCGMRASAFPLEPLAIEELRHERRFALTKPTLVRLEGDQRQAFDSEEWPQWRPILRGIRSKERLSQWHEEVQVLRSDGLIEFTTSIDPQPRGEGLAGLGVAVYRVLRTFAHLLVRAEAMRTLIGRPDLEYALDFEWEFPHGTRCLFPPTDAYSGPFRSGEAIEPRNRVVDYELPPRDHLPRLWLQLQDDIQSSFGLDGVRPLVLDFEGAVANVLARAEAAA